MGKPKLRRVNRPKKRKFTGNRFTGNLKKNSDVIVDSLEDTSVTSNNDQPSDHEVNNGDFDVSAAFVRTPASVSKLKSVVSDDCEFDPDEKLTGFRFVDLALLIAFVKQLLCPECKQPLGANGRLSRVSEEKVNLASKLVFTCGCQHNQILWTSKKCRKVFEVNRRFPMSILALEKNASAAKRFLGHMNMPPPPHKKSWQNHKLQILKATQSVAIDSLQAAVSELKATVGTDNIVSVDGTWHRRGFSSKHGVVTTLSVNGANAKVIDTETLSNYCDACARRKKKCTDQEFAAWHATHVARGECEKKT